MATTQELHCPACGWTGDQLTLDTARGVPLCPDCGSRVTLGRA